MSRLMSAMTALYAATMMAEDINFRQGHREQKPVTDKKHEKYLK